MRIEDYTTIERRARELRAQAFVGIMGKGWRFVCRSAALPFTKKRA